MTTIKFYILGIMILSIMSTCKQITCGCTVGTDTKNYNPNAECEDGSCIFYSEINIIPDSVYKYPVDVYIDNVYQERLTKVIVDFRNDTFGFTHVYGADEIHYYKVTDDFGKVWEDTFSVYNTFKEIKNINLKR
ncbi:MAG: hypothetical protein V4613_14195 [Bacteroidota bacterium]